MSLQISKFYDCLKKAYVAYNKHNFEEKVRGKQLSRLVIERGFVLESPLVSNSLRLTESIIGYLEY